jgi:hypothetical protein
MTAERIANTCNIPTSVDLLATIAQSFLSREQSFNPSVSKFDVTGLSSFRSHEGPISQHTRFPRVLTDFANAALVETNASWILTRTGMAEQRHGAEWIDKAVNGSVRGFTDFLRELQYIGKSGIIPLDTTKERNNKSVLIGYALITGQLLALLSISPAHLEHKELIIRVMLTSVVGGITGNIGLKKFSEGMHMLPTVSKGEKFHIYTWL